MAQNFEEIFDASSAHKMHVLIVNYKRYVCVCVCACAWVCVCVCVCVCKPDFINKCMYLMFSWQVEF